MDAQYLNKHVNGALTEAVTAMAVMSPDDPVEFIGQYLLTWVARKEAQEELSKSLNITETKLAEFVAEQEEKQKIQQAEEAKTMRKKTEFEEFLKSLPKAGKTKEEIMDKAVNFMQAEMGIPAAYVAVKKTVGETETLNYLSASSNASSVKGKKLTKATAEEAGDEENPVERLGVSFEAFKLPEVTEEEEPPEPEEGAEPLPPKPAPTPSPLVIDNAMRDKRCKFFGIPKIGAFAACPFSYKMIDHEGGCQLTPGDADAGTSDAFTLNPIACQFIIAFDSVGAYKLFSPEDIEAVNRIGGELCKAFESIDEGMGAKHLDFINSSALSATAAAITDVTGKLPDLEAAAMADSAKLFEVQEGGDPPEEPHELKRPAIEAERIADAYSDVIGSSISSSMEALEKHILPLPSVALSLLHVSAMLVGVPSIDCVDCCGDPSWSIMRENLIPKFASALKEFKSAEPRMDITKEASTAGIKAQCEALNLLDASVYPANIPVLGLLAGWLGKALAARDAWIAYSTEGLQTPLESVVA